MQTTTPYAVVSAATLQDVRYLTERTRGLRRAGRRRSTGPAARPWPAELAGTRLLGI